MNGTRVLFVITKSGWGGAQAYVYALATGLRAKGAEVHVAMGNGQRPGSDLLYERLREAGIETHIVPSLTRDISWGKEWAAFKELRSVIRELKPDVLHVNSSKASGLGALAGKIEKVPRIVFTVHGWPYKEPGSFRRSWLIWFASLATLLLSHVAIVVSKADKRTVLGAFPHVRHIPLGMEPVSLLTREEARTALNLDQSHYVLGSIAELNDNKGIEYGIRAFAELKARGAADRYVLMGDGELKTHLVLLSRELGVANDVIFAGFVPDARRYLNALDVMLLPSLKEGLPYAALEAAAAGIRIVASDVGGIPDALHGYKGAALVPPRRPDALALAVVKLKKQEQPITPKDPMSLSEMIEQTALLY